MEKIAFAFAFILIASPALAQSAPAQSVAEVSEQANGIIQALQAQRNASMDQAAAAASQVAKLTKEVEKLTKELSDAKSPKKVEGK